MNYLSRSSALSAAILFSLHSGARADEVKTLETVVVTANRSEIPADEVLASVTVITRQDIERSQAPDLSDLLARQAGVDVVRTGGPGSTNTVFLRGGNANHTLVLIDGVRVNTTTQGSFDFAHLPLAQIERIEIVRGPRAALWGSDAISGVIHVFTRDPATAYVQARAGSYGRVGVDAGVGHEYQNSSIGLGGGFERVRGFSASDPNAYSYDPDDDGYRNRHANLRARTALGSQRLSFTGLISDADVQFDQGETAVLNREFGLVLAGDLSPRWSHSLTLGHNSEDQDTPVFGSRFGSERDSLDWVNTLEADPRNQFNLGLNLSRESGFSKDEFSGVLFDESRHNAAVFASWRGRFSAHTLELSARRDQNSQFDGAITGNAAWGWQANDALRMRLSWGQGFRAPNFNELYYPGFYDSYAGNPTLLPERSLSKELGLDWRFADNQSLGLSAYRTQVRDLIAFVGPFYSAVNIAQATIDGIELDYRLSHAGFTLSGNATWQNARDAETGEALLRRPDRKLQLSAGYRFDNSVTVGLDASAFSNRSDFDGDLPGYARFDLSVSRPLTAGWTLDGRLENLADRDYRLVSGYNTPGRSLLFNLRWEEKK